MRWLDWLFREPAVKRESDRLSRAIEDQQQEARALAEAAQELDRPRPPVERLHLVAQ